ncbi:thiol reductant ABC exporter subunit CydD [Priestia taiwanensis]|uniref:Thiol reductant ABC exporter subunit CydD n=1 Tax=Priestia taiwanensis TaxID=1347902 RepID=A0A917ATT3_9BACI|nr:thiol reductant ABC exporter subunit CydD [Priestia taiwanensis]MBM7365218.1 ATP-binding cassette subfamily C protein CydD [Priestia taiwanensis]GGE73605.1 thiol reductant ABC exporter subunit CydD [Priestia taiwanensis]
MAGKRGLPSYPGSRSLYITLSFLILLESFTIVGQAIFLARAITFLFEGMAVQEVFIEVIWFFIIFLARHLLAHIQQMFVERFAERTGKALREQVVRAYFQLGPKFIQTNGTGRLVTLAVEGIEKLKTFIELTIPRMIRCFIVPFVVVLYVFTEDISSAVILIVTIPLIIVFMILLGLAAKKMADSQYATYRVLSNSFLDTLKGLETLKYLGKSRKHEKKIEHVSENYRKATMKTLRVAFSSSFAMDFFTSLSIAFVAVGLGLRLIDGEIFLLPALTILILAPEYFLPLRQVGANYHATLDGRIAMEEIEEVVKQQQKMPLPNMDARIKWTEDSVITLNNVAFQHPNTENAVLSNLSFSWEGTGLIGLIGASGAGKSTLIDVLAGFLQPTEGTVTVDGSNTTSLAREDWKRNIAYIPQSPYVFPVSLLDNIRFYEPDATEGEVEKVVDEVGLRSLVSQLQNGIHECIGEGGRMLSGGQEQRVAIARALLSKRPIILLDEPTAHLDVETEFEMKPAMLHLFKDKLVFLATHRLHWTKQMDHILVLEDGKVVQQGKHEALMTDEQGVYRMLAHMTTGGRV